MKNKILISSISFIFLCLAYSLNLYANTNEITNTQEKMVDIENENIVQIDTQEENKDETNEQEKKEIEKQNIVQEEIIEEQEVIETVEEVMIGTNLPNSYQGTMNLETPQSNASFLRPDKNTIEVSGWAVSNDANAVLRILVDGNVVKNNVTRTKRGDVDTIISPNYGGVQNTSNAGFSEKIDISNLASGFHAVKVEQISRYGDLIVEYVAGFNVTNKKFKGTMNLESPQNTPTFIRPDKNTIEVRGWAVSNDANAVLRILVDGNVVKNNVTRTKRGDVDIIISPNYGGVKNTPNAGFSEKLDISNLGAGLHIVKVEQISRYGDLIVEYVAGFNVTNKKFKGTMNLESPQNSPTFTRPDKKTIEVRGWAVSNDANAVLRILVDGNVVKNNVTRTKRGDVDVIISPNYGGVQNTPNAGFSEKVDISNLGAGFHVVKVEQISRYGDLIVEYVAGFNIANKKYQGTMYLESPQNTPIFTRPDNKTMEVKGWAVSEDENAVLRILVDGNVVKNNVTRTKRGDVDAIISPNYGGVQNTPNAGFSEKIDISNLAAGFHVVKVEQISRYGDLIVEYVAGFNIANKQYRGEMCIDMPVMNTSYEADGRITIAGWAVAEDEAATAEIYIDNIWKATADRYDRQDVVFYSNKYGGKTINAGFGKMLSCSELSAGAHKLTVYEKSRYGDIIGGVEVQIVIKAKQVIQNPVTQPSPETNRKSYKFATQYLNWRHKRN